MVDAEVARRAAQPQTPADFAMRVSRGKWKMAPHLKLLNQKLTDLASGKIKRLIVAMPPRHGKSELCSKYFPAWYLGRYPDNRIILCSYQAEFASTWGERARDLISEFGPSIFGLNVSEGASARDNWRIDKRDGGMVTAGAESGITGKGANILVIDDPFRGAKDAASKTIRQSVWDFWDQDASTRLEPGASVMVIATRWHLDDLTGRLLAQEIDEDEPSDENWEVLNLPALAEDNDPMGRKPGEALWPERYDRDKLLRIKRKKSVSAWNSLYQQRPTAPGGSIFKRETFRYYEILAVGGETIFYKMSNAAGGTWTVKASECVLFIVVDSAASEKKSADFTVIQVWALTPGYDALLVDMWRDQARAPKVRENVIRLYRQWKCEFAAVEKNTVGLPLLQSLRDANLTIKSVEARVDKVMRADAAEMRFAGGMIHFPKVPMFSRELAALIEELESFPKGVHDDCVDAVVWMAYVVNKLGGSVRDREDIEYAEKTLAEESAAEQRALAPGGKIEQLQLAGPEDPDELWLES